MPVSVEPVHLRSFLGLQPGVYLTILYVLGIGLLVFMIGFLPGILSSGKRVVFQSNLIPTAVYVDGRNVGTTPTTVFLSSGTYEVTYAYKDILSSDFILKVGHPVFLTWLFPRRQEVSHEVLISGISTFRSYVEHMFSEIIGWSAVTDFSDTYHYPPLFTQIARSVISQSRSSDRSLLVFDCFSETLRHITSDTLLLDAMEAFRILQSESYLSDSQNATLSGQLEKIKLLFNGAVDDIGLAPVAVEFQRSLDSLPTNPSTIGFLYQGGSFTLGESVPRDYPGVIRMGIATSVLPFSISALEVSEYQWAMFMQDNAYWSKENLDQLIRDGKVDGNYLAGIYPSTTLLSNRPIKNISWHAAKAFCVWLGDRTGFSVDLPTEAQWEYAARSVSDKSYQTNLSVIVDSKGPSGMMGGFWEFTADTFIPLSRYLGSWTSILHESADIVVKGGSYLNDPHHITIATVGVQRREACSETTGFRIAWTK